MIVRSYSSPYNLHYKKLKEQKNHGINFKANIDSFILKNSDYIKFPELIKEWEIISNLDKIVQCYVAAEEKTFDALMPVIKQELRIEGNIINIELKNGFIPSIVDNLMRAKENILSQPGKKVLLTVKKFEERFIDPNIDTNYFRCAHDYNQEVIEADSDLCNKAGIIPRTFADKNLIIITNISKSQGECPYSRAKGSAYKSQFINIGPSGLAEIEEITSKS